MNSIIENTETVYLDWGYDWLNKHSESHQITGRMGLLVIALIETASIPFIINPLIGLEQLAKGIYGIARAFFEQGSILEDRLTTEEEEESEYETDGSLTSKR